MLAIAQTLPGLVRQLVDAGWTDEALARARRAHDLGRQLFAGLHNGDGRPFVCHLIGLASLLQTYGQAEEVVIAGLLHSVYAHGDFGPLCSFARARERVRRHAGAEVEALVARFHTLAWNRKGLRRHAAEVGGYDPIDRAALVMRLANEVDHLADGAALHRADAERYLAGRVERMPLFEALAAGLDVPAIARDLDVLVRDVQDMRFPVVFRGAAVAPQRIVSPSFGARPLPRLLARLDAALPRGERVRAARARFWPRRG